jgi:hypothetical protein
MTASKSWGLIAPSLQLNSRYLDFRGLSGEGRCVCPGQPEDGDFLGCWLVGARCLKSGGDDDAAELGGHVGGGWLGLACVPRGGRASFVQVGGVVPGGGIPGDGDGLAGDLEREGPLDRGCGAVAGLPGSEDLLGVLDRDLSQPPLMPLKEKSSLAHPGHPGRY